LTGNEIRYDLRFAPSVACVWLRPANFATASFAARPLRIVRLAGLLVFSVRFFGQKSMQQGAKSSVVVPAQGRYRQDICGAVPQPTLRPWLPARSHSASALIDTRATRR